MKHRLIWTHCPSQMNTDFSSTNLASLGWLFINFTVSTVCVKNNTRLFLTSALVDWFLKPFTDTILRKLSNYYSLQGLPSHLNCAAIRLCEIQKSEITAEPLLVPSKLIGRNSTKLNSMYMNKNSSQDEIANVNVLRRHRTCRGQKLRTLNWVENWNFENPSWNLVCELICIGALT